MKMINETTHKIYIGDVKNEIKKIENESIQLIITSPPYWNIKDYGIEDQIGFGQEYKDYIKDLNFVWRNCYKKLSPGCKMIINIGDQYLRASENNGKYEILPIYLDIISKCRDIGFTFLGNIIWRKISNMKTSGGGSWMGSTYYPRDGYITYEHENIMALPGILWK